MRWLRLVGLLIVVGSLVSLSPNRARAADERRWLAEPMLLAEGKTAAAVDVAPVDATHTWAIQGNNILFFDGTNWSVQFTSPKPFVGIEMSSATKGWALAQGSQISADDALFYMFNGISWQIDQQPNTITSKLVAAADGTLLATGWNGINGSNGRTTLEYFDGSEWRVITPFDRASYTIQTTANGATWIWGNAFNGISMFDTGQPFVLRYANGTFASVNVPSAGASGPDVVNREGLTSVHMISTVEGWASMITTADERKVYHYLNGVWNETSVPLPIEAAGATYQRLHFVAGNTNEVLAVIIWNFGLTGCGGPNTVLRYAAGAWSIIGATSASLNGALLPNGNGWFSSYDCVDAPAVRYRYADGVLSEDTAGSDIVPTAYQLLSDAVQWAVAPGTVLRNAASTMPTAPVAAQTGARFFPETGHNLSGPFRAFYESHGLDFGESGISAGESLALFGLPLTEPFREINPDTGDYLTVQYFERVRMEYHPTNPDPYKVLLGRLGAVRYIQAYNRIGEGDPSTPLKPECERFVENGFDLCPPFREYWRSVGSVQIFGLPIDNAFAETSYTDGATYLTQWTERERLEQHPELAGTRYEILLGLLAKEDLRQRGYLEK